MKSPRVSPYRSLVAEVHRRLLRLTACVAWMLERGHRDTASELIRMLSRELQFHHVLASRRLHPVVARLSPPRVVLLTRLEADHRQMAEELERLVGLLAHGCDTALVLKRTQRLHDNLLDHFRLEDQAFGPLEGLAALNADMVAPGT